MPQIGGVFVRDDLMPSMKAPETPRPGLGDILSSAAEGAYSQVRYGLPYQFKKMADTLQPGDEAFYQKGLYEGGQAASKASAASVDDLTSGRVGFGRFVAENLVTSLPYMVGGAVGAVGGGLVGGPGGAVAGAVAGGVPQFAGSNVARAVEEQGGLSDQTAARSLLAAPFQSAADAAIGRFLPGAGHVIGDAAATQTGNFLRRTAVSMAKAGATEAVTEAAQQVGERYAAGIPTGDADAVGEYVNAAVTAFAVGGALGAGGGFRRTAAVAKPVEQVTPDDMLSHINGVLDGTARAEPLALPSPADFHVGADGVSRINPSGTQQLALPSPEMIAERYPQTDFYADADGRVAAAPPEGIDPVELANLPRPSTVTTTPEAQAFVEQAVQPVDVPLTGSTSLSRGLEGTSVELPAPLSPLSSEQIVPPFADPAAPRVMPEPRRDPVTGEEVPFDQHLGELKKGLRGGFVQTVEATDEMDLMGKVYDQIFVEQDTRSNTAKFAQRLGILDENLEPTPLAQLIEQQRAEAAPTTEAVAPAAPTTPVAPVAAAPEARMEPNPAVLPDVALETNKTVDKKGPQKSDAASTAPGVSGGVLPTAQPSVPQLQNTSIQISPEIEAEMAAARKAANIERSTSDKGLDTPVDVFRALATDPSTAGSGNASRVEKLAQKLGLITDDDARDVTPKGRQTYLQSGEGMSDIVDAAGQQGYAGTQQSLFERGAQSIISGNPSEVSLTSPADWAAHQAGANWAKDFIENGDGTRTAAQTNAIQSRLLAKSPNKAQRMRVESKPKSPAELQRKSLHDLVNTVDLSMAPDQEVAQLRRMIGEGADVTQVTAAIQKLQGGDTIRTVPPRPVPREGTGGRGQPIFKEMNTPERGAQKADQRFETEGAVRTYDLRNLIKFALDEKAITDVRAAKLHALLDEGKVDQVARLLKDFDPDYTPKQRTSRSTKFQATPEREAPVGTLGRLLGDNDIELEQALADKSFSEVVDHLIETAPSTYYREVMKMVHGLMKQIEKTGNQFHFFIVQPGDTVPRSLNNMGVRAIAHQMHNPNETVVYVKGSEMGLDAGVNHQVLAHEMLHAVSMAVIKQGKKLSDTSPLGKAVKDLNELRNAVIEHFNARAAAGNLNEFEKAYFQRENNSLADPDEVLAWGLTNPAMQRYLASIEYKPKQSVFGRLVELLSNLLGLDHKYDSALTELLRVSERILKAKGSELASAFPRNDPDGFVQEALEQHASEIGTSAANRTVQAANEATKGAAAVLDKVADTLNWSEVKVAGFRKVLGWLSHNQIDRQFGQLMPGLIQHSDAHRERVAVRSRFEQMGDEAYQNFEKLERENKNAAEWVGQLMALTTEFQVDPDKAWDDHKHFGKDADTAKLKTLYDAAQKIKNDLKRGDGAGWKMFNEFRTLNEAQNYARMASGLHGLVAMDPELSLGVTNADINPVDLFMREEGLITADAIKDRWSDLLHKQIAATTAFVNEKKGEAARGTEADQRQMAYHLSPIEMQIADIHQALNSMGNAPYFHLGRFGDYFGSATLRTVDGKADPKALKHVAEVLDKAGFSDVQISTDSAKPKIALRFDKLDQAQRFQSVMQELKTQGWLSEKEDINVGPRSRETNFGVADGLPDYVRRYVQSIEASPMFIADEGMDAKERAGLEARKADAVRLAIDTWLEQQPDSSISKVLVKRYTVPGYNKDMIRNFAHRWRVGSISIANKAAQPKFDRAFVAMRSQVNEATTQDVKQATKLNDLMTEMKARDSSSPVSETADTFDKLRAFSHSYFLGMSPAYALVNMTQLGVTAMPELAKVHGYAKSFHAMRRASTTAFKILKAATNEAAKLGPKHYADVAITEAVLAKAGLSDAERNFAMHMLATGTIDIGSAARALGQVAEDRVGSKVDVALKYASALGMYTETFSRLVTALAARELHGNKPGLEAYATKVVSNSMFDYQSWNTARQLGKQGFLGPVTPIVTQFMSYSTQLTEKLYSEAMDAFGRARPGESVEEIKQRRSEARRFLAGHLTAVTALAGTLGLPFATVFAKALEVMVDGFDDDDDPFDITAAWRGFLSDTLGKGAGEVVARGLPRALGFDLSSRAGEQNLLPFSELLADRRSWKEALANSAGRGLGAVPSMITNVVDGGGQIADGDLLGGMKTMLPVAFKGPLEAYRMSTEGYVDTKGNKLPLTPTASSYLYQLIGFAPSEKAEYSEARGDQQARRGEITREAETLRKGIVKALLVGDQDKAGSLIADARKFDTDNPAFAVIPSLAGALTRQMQSRSKARALQSPVGVSLQDMAGQSMTRYANIDY